MKLYSHKLVKNEIKQNIFLINILLAILLISTFSCVKVTLTQSKDAIPNDQYKQAPIPANVIVMQDMPQFGEKMLEKWDDYVVGNMKMIRDFKSRKDRAILNLYKNKFSRMAKMSQDITMMELEKNNDPKLPTD
jgi:hypothetical protein